MNSRERVLAALDHRQPDRTPIDLGSNPVSGIQASTLHKLLEALGLIRPEDRVKVEEPFQMLGLVTNDLRDALGIDTVGLGMTKNMFGFRNADWKPWVAFDGTPLLVPEKFNIEPAETGEIFQYPEGDQNIPPSGRMPVDGYYFDAVIRQDPIDDGNLKVEDNLEEFGPVSDEDLRHLERTSLALRRETDLAVVGTFGGTSFGDIALVPGLNLKHPKGIRDVEEWYVSTVIRRDYIMEVFERQCARGLLNLKLIREAVDDRVDVIFVSGTDFGTQMGTFIAPEAYRELYQPFHKRINDWVHSNTPWKTFIHSCGSVEALIDDFIDSGFDILNPVQTAAAKMEPSYLKSKYGDRISFWGGGVDTQKTLPFGTVEEVAEEVSLRAKIFGKNGGFVFNPTHNVQADCPVENVIMAFRTAAGTVL